LTTGQYTADTAEQDLQQAMSEIRQALDKMQGTEKLGAGAASTGGGGATAMAASPSVSAQDVQALDFWGDLLGTALKVAPIIISLLEAQDDQAGAQQQGVQLQSVSAQDWQSIVGDVLKLIPQVISLFSVKLAQVGPQAAVSAQFDWGGLLKVVLDTAPAIINLFQVQQAGAQQQGVQLQSVSAQDWQSIVSGILKLAPTIISLFQAQQIIQQQGTGGGTSVQSFATQQTQGGFNPVTS